MKKTILSLACCFMAMAFGACSSSDDEGGSSNPTPPALTNKSIKHETFDLRFKNTAIPFEEVVFTETDKVIVGPMRVNIQDQSPMRITRSHDRDEVRRYEVGTYERINSTYHIYYQKTSLKEKAIAIQVLSQTAKSAQVKVTLLSGGEIEDEFEDEAEVVEKISAGEITEVLCREWKVASARLRHKGSVTGVKQFEGAAGENPASLNDILAYAKKKATINENFDKDMTITSIQFSDANTFCIYFANGQNYIGSWSWGDMDKGYINYVWHDASMGNKFENGQAVFDVRTYKQQNYYTLTLGAEINDSGNPYDIELTFYLNEL